MKRFSLSITAQTGSEFVLFLRRFIPRAQTALDRRFQLRDLSIALVGDRRMGELHEEFMSITGPTDVLTFPLDTNARGRVTSGEVVICVPEARRQARSRGIPPRLEVLLYAIHGMLHLLGYDDRTDRGYRAMHAAEDRILTQLGLGKVFARPIERGRP